MENMKISCWILVLAGLLLAVCGCNNTHALKKQAMVEKWQDDTAQNKVPLIGGMIERGEIEQAQKMLVQCLLDNETHAPYHLLMGRIHFIEERNEQARQSFQTAVGLDDQLADGWHCLGSLSVLDKTYGLAIEYYQKACKLEPDNAGYVIAMADVLVETGQNYQATQLVSEMLERHSQSLELMLALAQIKQQAGQADEAIGVYEQAQLRHGHLPEILTPCAYAYLTQGQWANATRKFEQLLVQYKDDKTRYYATLRSIATCSLNSGNYGRAMDCYDELSVAFRDDSTVWLSMAQCALGADDADEAVHYARKALKYQPQCAGAYAVLGSSFYLKGDYQESLASFDRITSDDKLGGFAWFMTGRCCQQLGRTEQASAAYQRAEQLDPESELITLFLKKTVQSL